MSALKKMTAIGRMDRRITIQNFMATQDESGGEILTWSDWKHVSAKMEYPPTVGSEQYLGIGEQGLQQTALRTQIFTIRYISGLNEKMRVIYERNVYDIISIQELGRRRFWQIQCQIKD